jgi:hypothetical protein
MVLRSLVFWLLAVPVLAIPVAIPVLALLTTGCTVQTTPAPLYAEATYVPAHIYLYPHRIYDDRVVYFVDNHWYYNDGRRWMYYRAEPSALRGVRPYVQRAPPARRYAPSGNYYAAPPARQYAPPAPSYPPVAPPAPKAAR